MPPTAWLHDSRTDCWSVLTTITIKNYLKLIEAAHASQGSINGQRDVLQTTTAKRIRERMVRDITQGAVLPPVVIGAVVSKQKFKTYPMEEVTAPNGFLTKNSLANLSIIDGMQRTASYIEASKLAPEILEWEIRVEFWLARSVRALVYRMLVLNTGQVPWTLSRQLSVVYKPLLEEIKESVPQIDRIFTPDEPGKRIGSAQFSSDALVELYIAFSLRKTTVDTKEALSEEFSRLDFVENLSDQAFQEQFYEALKMMTNLDIAFEKYSTGPARYQKGRHVFDGQPARIGFIVAIALHALGRPGLDKNPVDRDKIIKELAKYCAALVSKISKYSVTKMGDFLKLDILAEVLARRSTQVGRFERNVFFEAFKVLIDEKFDLPNLEPCWRAA
ncbi:MULTISPECIES: hypothetical protein [unclassified Janthinobacterium]|uniref:hypothetical protein n=1 Tax=unclassified Janthinobacterium TaxID=2610881 RepID=UPI0017A50FB6|nr:MULTISPECIES: hypothetical protein [unclassified Janthinobacterium]MBB5609027.1 hypothetical protein [Janthinobacterium sp. S3T4]MBB5614242.1 hypothetical protein [Janthinobacterium sp. S3M3]